METTIKDLQKLKLSPSLIVFLKTISSKNNEYLQELAKVADIERMAAHLQDQMIIKIVGGGNSCSDFEIRKLDIINYLKLGNDETLATTKAIFKHFVSVMEQYTKKTSRMKFATYQKFLRGRINQGVDLETAKSIISMKFKEWYDNNSYQKHLNFQTLLGSTHYPQYALQLELEKDGVEEDLNMEKA